MLKVMVTNFHIFFSLMWDSMWYYPGSLARKAWFLIFPILWIYHTWHEGWDSLKACTQWEEIVFVFSIMLQACTQQSSFLPFLWVTNLIISFLHVLYKDCNTMINKQNRMTRNKCTNWSPQVAHFLCDNKTPYMTPF